MKKVLIVSYYFPPKQSIGSLRSWGLVKYLPKFGWEPVVLCSKLPEYSRQSAYVVETKSLDMINLLEKATGLYQVNKLHYHPGNKRNKLVKQLLDAIVSLLSSFLAFPDRHILWYGYALKKGCALLRDNEIQGIISTSWPYTAHLIARKLKLNFKKPWIADLRDLWTQNHYHKYKNKVRYYLERELEVRTLQDADALVTVSEPLAAKLKNLHNKELIYAVPNGFDFKEFKSLSENSPEKFTITYAGSLYEGMRDPKILFQAISQLVAEGKVNKNCIRVDFFGPLYKWLLKEVQLYNLEDIVDIHGLLPRSEVLQKEICSSALLLLLWNNPNEAGVYTGKLFEYLGARRPIIAIGGPRGVVKELLEETQAGFYASNLHDLKKILLILYDEYRREHRVTYKAINEKLSKYTQEAMAKKFAKILNSLL